MGGLLFVLDTCGGGCLVELVIVVGVVGYYGLFSGFFLLVMFDSAFINDIWHFALSNFYR